MATFEKTNLDIDFHQNKVQDKTLDKDASQSEELEKHVKTKLSPYPYYSVYIFPCLTVLAILAGGYYSLLVGFAFYTVVPLLEYLMGSDGYNPSKEECKHLENLYSFRIITWLWAPTQLSLVLFASWFASSHWTTITWPELIGLLMSIGTNGATGIAIAHELIHKNTRLEQNLGKTILFLVLYPHFFIEHLLGHHKRVATYEDPATSRFGESLYTFLPRSIKGSYLSAWNLEFKRLAKKNLPPYSLLHNQMIQWHILTVFFSVGLYLFFGLHGVLVFFIQGILAFVQLEIINYVEHYGLQRREIGTKGSGVFEKVTPLHSWNADHRITNYLSFKLQRHSDHHTWPFRRYQTLRSWDFSPQLPTGYVGMLVLALFPPFYFFVMDPKVERYNALMFGSNPREDE